MLGKYILSVGDCVVGKLKVTRQTRVYTVVAAVSEHGLENPARSFSTVASHKTETQEQSSMALHILVYAIAFMVCTLLHLHATKTLIFLVCRANRKFRLTNGVINCIRRRRRCIIIRSVSVTVFARNAKTSHRNEIDKMETVFYTTMLSQWNRIRWPRARESAVLSK